SFETQPYAGLVARVVVRTDGCRNPVHVSVAIGGTTEVWRLAGNRSLPAEQAIGVGVSGGRISAGRLDPVDSVALQEATSNLAIKRRTRTFHFDGVTHTRYGVA